MFDEVLILMKDKCTQAEAKRFLKNGTIIFDSVSEYIQELKNSDIYSGETEEAIRDGRITDVSAVTYANHEYCIVYVR